MFAVKKKLVSVSWSELGWPSVLELKASSFRGWPTEVMQVSGINCLLLSAKVVLLVCPLPRRTVHHVSFMPFVRVIGRQTRGNSFQKSRLVFLFSSPVDGTYKWVKSLFLVFRPTGVQTALHMQLLMPPPFSMKDVCSFVSANFFKGSYHLH